MKLCRCAILLALAFLVASLSYGQTPPPSLSLASFAGISASQITNGQFEVDPSGAVGTRQYLEYVNTYYQAYSKVSPYTPVWSAPQPINTPFTQNGLSNCYDITGDAVILFDHLASRWVISAHTASPNNYYYCIAVSNTADLSSTSLKWFTYSLFLNPVMGTNSKGDFWFPDWPRMGIWSDAYYVSIDLNDRDNNFQEVGVVACAFDRTNMIKGLTARTPQCFETPSPVTGALYLAHSLIPADLDGKTAPPAGRQEYFVSIENPPADGKTSTSNTFNLWAFHVDWTIPANSTFTQSTISEAPYTPGCYDLSSVTLTTCVPEPSTGSTGQFVDSVGDRFEPRFSYRNFGTYESFLVSHTVQVGSGSSQQTGIRWYELRGSGTPTLFNDGNISPDNSTYRFVPSIAQDHTANAFAGYSVSSSTVHPGIRGAYWNLLTNTKPAEINIFKGVADQENTWRWGSYTSMTVDPVDDCTFWYSNEYFPTNQTGTSINWATRIAKFKITTCK